MLIDMNELVTAVWLIDVFLIVCSRRVRPGTHRKHFGSVHSRFWLTIRIMENLTCLDTNGAHGCFSGGFTQREHSHFG